MADNRFRTGVGRNSARYYEWSRLVKQRDGECKNCGVKEKLHAHHIIPWKINKEKRFDVNNGLTLCRSCHKKVDGCKPAGWNKGLKRREEWCKKLSHALKGRKTWNKGIKGLNFSPETQFKKGQTPWNKGNIYKNPKERICKSCKNTKKITEFTPMQRGKFYSHICKKCRNERLRK